MADSREPQNDCANHGHTELHPIDLYLLAFRRVPVSIDLIDGARAARICARLGNAPVQTDNAHFEAFGSIAFRQIYVGACVLRSPITIVH